jgi:hypothetical protein
VIPGKPEEVLSEQITKPTVRKAQFLRGYGMPKEAKAVSRKAKENGP